MDTYCASGRRLLVAALMWFACTWGAMASVNVNSFVVDSPPALECSTIAVTVAGTNNATDYIFNGTNFTVSGFNITIDVNYIAGFVITPGSTPFSHGLSLGTLPKGTYTVTTNGNLNSAVQSTLVSTLVVGSCCPAEAGFTSNDTILCAGDTAHFTNTSTGSVNQYWYVNGSLVASQFDYEHSFNAPGKYTVKLLVDDGSCSDSVSKEVSVLALPSVNLGNDTTICDGDAIVLNATIAGGGHYSWQDGTQHPLYTVNDSGLYTVTVENEDGCITHDSVYIGLKDCSATGLESNPSIITQLDLFPNPTTTSFQLSTPFKSGGTLILYNVQGKQLLQEVLPAALQHEVVLPKAIKKGVYFVLFQTSSGIYRAKLTVTE
jgi:PKD repeat protein